MAHEYPPKITAQTFDAAIPPLLAVVGACPLNTDRCGVSYLRLQGTGLTGFQHGDVIDLASVANGRSRFAPNVDNLTIEWAFSGHQFITGARLEVFAAGVVGALWTYTFNWLNVNDRQANGTQAFNGQLANQGPGGEFPDSFLTVTYAPYQVSLTIVSVEENTEVMCRRRWFYLDVVVDHIELALGPRGLLNVQHGQFQANRYYSLNAAMYDAVATQLTPQDQMQPQALTSPHAPAEVELRLGSNIFAKSSDDFYDNTMFAATRAVWLDDPMLPLIVRVYVQQHDGDPAPLVNGAAALGGLELLWDWLGGDGALANAHQLPTAYVHHAVAYKPEVWPRAVRNCHVDHGGKRGAGPMFTGIRPPNAQADAFTTAATQNRPWALYSTVVSDVHDANAGTSGVHFRPSRIAGDEYRITVYPVLPNRAAVDVARASAFDPVVVNLPSARSTSKFTVWKIVTVARHWSKHQTAHSARLNWARVNRYFAPARVRITPPAQVSLIDAANGGDYDQAFVTVAPTLAPAHRFAIDATVQNQINGDYGFARAAYDDFVAAVDIHVAALQQLVTIAAPNDQQAVLQAQVGPLNTQRFTPEYLYLDRVADTTATPAALRERALRRLDINGPNTYGKATPEWGTSILSRVATEFQRVVTPDTPGLHLFEFVFTDNALGRPNVAEAVTTISNRTNCRECNGVLPHITPADWNDAAMAANRRCPNCASFQDDDATILSYTPFTYIDGQLDDWGRQNLGFADRLAIGTGGEYGTSASLAIAHEIGHQLGLPHAPPQKPKVLLFINATVTGGIKASFHDAVDEKCAMSYNVAYAAELHFCGVCVLRLRGWSAGPSDPNAAAFNAAHDGQTVALSNAGLQNSGIDVALGAAWDPDAGTANCTRCNTAFSTTVRKHHCRRCGHIFCEACSNRTAPVRNPLSSNNAVANPPVQEVRVCIPCHTVWTAPD